MSQIHETNSTSRNHGGNKNLPHGPWVAISQLSHIHVHLTKEMARFRNSCSVISIWMECSIVIYIIWREKRNISWITNNYVLNKQVFWNQCKQISNVHFHSCRRLVQQSKSRQVSRPVDGRSIITQYLLLWRYLGQGDM